jgi:hypothetical protein
MGIVFREKNLEDANSPFEYHVHAHLDDDEDMNATPMSSSSASARKQIHRIAWEAMPQTALRDNSGLSVLCKDMMLFVIIPPTDRSQ